MDNGIQIGCLQDDLDALLTRYAFEFDLSCAAVIGALEIAKADVLENYYAARAERLGGEDEA